LNNSILLGILDRPKMHGRIFSQILAWSLPASLAALWGGIHHVERR
jgi:hypothetical protein